ncbi:competence/damage-inducible protein A [Staphylospora marina]|uniref:competence/damage-inducible protein A n=1 Tax=Staphylospora marina TaxID=2490858 RepID=UPI000F5B96F6|nr:competence/damage-inducible protein A [Staphylospora marina]
MTAEIITVGTELITGNTVDTHSAWLSRRCFSLGIEVRFHSSVGDDREALLQVLKLASGRSSLVILCGGLGPTMDDLTKETVAEFLGITLRQDPEVLERLERLFAGRGVPMPPNNRKQALVFPGGTVFHNDRGTAPGLSVTQGGVTYVLLPGPPGELYPMFEKSVRPFLLERFSKGKVYLSETLSFFGIGESALEEKLKDLMSPQEGLVVATYAKEAGVSLRITAHGRTEKEARDRMLPVREEVLRRAGKYCYSPDDRSPEEAVVSLLAEAGKTVAVSESCTGGLLAGLISSVPGASRVLKGGFVAYTADVKENVAGVPAEIISRHGTVSAETAEALARHALERFDADYGISVTGVAGPASAEGKPPGLVFIGFAEKGKPVRCHRLDLKGDRRKIRLLTAKTACFILQQRLKKGETDA